MKYEQVARRLEIISVPFLDPQEKKKEYDSSLPTIQ